jgi:hypothetical protein
VINQVYGLTSAKFDNPFRDMRNVDNIVAKRGALFMIDLKRALQEKGVSVVHIKTDSVKIPDATPEIIKFVTEFGAKYGYEFEHEETYDKFCLVNDAVYVAGIQTVPWEEGHPEVHWTAVGAQFQHPYVFKTLFSGEELIFEDYCEARSVVKGTMYLYAGSEKPVNGVLEASDRRTEARGQDRAVRARERRTERPCTVSTTTSTTPWRYEGSSVDGSRRRPGGGREGRPGDRHGIFREAERRRCQGDREVRLLRGVRFIRRVMHLIRKSNTGMGMTILIVLAVGEIVYNTIFHPVKTYKLWCTSRAGTSQLRLKEAIVGIENIHILIDPDIEKQYGINTTQQALAAHMQIFDRSSSARRASGRKHATRLPDVQSTYLKGTQDVSTRGRARTRRGTCSAGISRS